MTNAKKVIVNRMIEMNLEQYTGFFDHDWAKDFVARVPSRLTDAAGSLCLAWKEASNTHRLPWLMVHQMTAFAKGFMKGHKSHMARLIDEFRGWVLRELDGSLKRAERKTVLEGIRKIDQRLRIADQEQNASFPAREYWDDIVQKSEFQLSISGSQNLAYCALVFAYEWFVVSCFRVLGGPEKYKPNEDRFWTEFTTLFGRDMKPDYWDDQPVKIARIARNCITHLGGKTKPELIAETPALWISPEGIVSVQPSDNRDLFTVLKGKVSQLVGELTPCSSLT
ncbi:MAG TPA: hypothetical protein VFG68_21640 [Fimbriiglobus sp.]|nr:hypothetical protein [Fimbriiglobus sp.]